MKKFLIILTIPLILFACDASQDSKEPISKDGKVEKNANKESVEDRIETIKTMKGPDSYGDSASYSMGFFDGQTLGRSPSFALEVLYYIKGFIAGYEGKDGFLTQNEIEMVLRGFTEQQIKLEQIRKEKQQKDMAEEGFKNNPELKDLAMNNLKAANDFLAKNKNKPGIITTPSGLQYEIIKSGKGSKPDFMSEVTMSVKGYLLDGKEIINTNDKEKPMTISVSQLAVGWGEVVQLMNPGSIYKAYITPDLAFGPIGLANTIPPNALLILEIELLEFKKPNIGDKK